MIRSTTRWFETALAGLGRVGLRQGTLGKQIASISSKPVGAAAVPAWARPFLRPVSVQHSLPLSRSWPTASTRLSALLRSSRRAFRSSARAQSAQQGSQPAAESLSLSARLRKLSREYGWATVGVYLALSVLDFPFCFLLVRTVGTDRIGEIEHWVVSNAARVIPQRLQDFWHDYRAALRKAEAEQLGHDDISDAVEMAGWGVKEAEEHNKAEASLATQLALAYAIHKSFIFVRVPLTAAVTPKVVKVLRSWGWKIGQRRVKGS